MHAGGNRQLSVLRCVVVMMTLSAAVSASALDPWWDAAWQLRTPLRIEVGEQDYAAGYAGYTVSVAVPIAEWRAEGLLREDCGDLRLIRRVPPDDELIPFSLIACDDAAAVIAFALRADLEPGASDATSYRLYAGNPDAALSPVTAADAVYAYDLATDPDPLSTLTLGAPRGPLTRPDEPGLAMEDGALRFEFGDGEGVRLQLPATGPDLALDLTLDHTACYPLNMHSGIGVRGDGDDPSLGIWYLRGWNRRCGGAYSDDGVITVDGEPLEMPDIAAPVPASDHRISLSIRGGDPAALELIDGERALSLEPPTDSSGELTSIQLGQEDGRITHLRARRYTEPEPVVTVGRAVRRQLLEQVACEATLPHELVLDAPTMRWISDRMTLVLELAASATLEDPREARQLLRISAAGAGGILRLDLLPGRRPALQFATRNGSISISGGSALAPDATHRIMLRYDGEMVQLWLDGELTGSAPASGALRQGDGPFPGLESLAPRIRLQRLTLYGAAINRVELEQAAGTEPCPGGTEDPATED
jgi:hypothetical protein